MSDLIADIMKLKKERNAVILAHLYQPGEIQEIADFVGDSLDLSRKAANTNADVIVFCGVHFMAETANILSPDKIVLLPAADAGCRMAEMISGAALAKKKAEMPNAVVVAYVNTTAEVKSLSDICCTSANAIKIVNSIPKDKDILFVPDKNLGAYVSEKTNRKMEFWSGFCPVHHGLFVEEVEDMREEHPNAKVLAHPECPADVLAKADYIGSTTEIINYAKASAHDEFIIATECGVFHQLEKDNPKKKFYLASDSMVCPNMKKISLEKIKKSLETLEPRVIVPAEMREKAVGSLTKMLEVCR